MKFVEVLLVFVALSVQFTTDGKTYKTCELARALSAENVPRALISNYVCLALAVSGSNTRKVTNSTPTTLNLGIFQINAKDYCGKNGKVGGKCNVTCEKLLDDAISDDIKCAQKIQTEYGFKQWARWNVRCKSPDPSNPIKFLPNLTNCNHR